MPWQYKTEKFVGYKTEKIGIKLYISENLMQIQSFWNWNKQYQIVNKKIMKKNKELRWKENCINYL